MKVTLKVWRQKNAHAPGRFQTCASPALNEELLESVEGKDAPYELPVGCV